MKKKVEEEIPREFHAGKEGERNLFLRHLFLDERRVSSLPRRERTETRKRKVGIKRRAG